MIAVLAGALEEVDQSKANTTTPLAMAFARVYIAAHYPADVAVGLMLGAAVA